MWRSTEGQAMPVNVVRTLLFLVAALSGYCEATFQWSCSTPDVFQSGSLYVPDVPASLESIGTTEQTGASLIYIYPIPSLNCQGTVTGVEYCYREADPSAIGSEIIFILYLMSRTSTANVGFTVDRDIPIPTPNTPPGQCSGMICCDSYTFINEQFELPQDDFNLGVLTPSSGNQIVAFHSSRAEFRVPGYQVNGGDFDIDVDPTISTVGARHNISLRILRLVVTGTSIAPTTAPTNATNATTSTTAQPTLAPQTSAAPIAVGVVVGLLVALVLIVVVVVLLVMYVRKKGIRVPEAKQRRRSEGRNLMASQHYDSPSPTNEGFAAHDYEEVDKDNALTVDPPHEYETIAGDEELSHNPAYGVEHNLTGN